MKTGIPGFSRIREPGIETLNVILQLYFIATAGITLKVIIYTMFLSEIMYRLEAFGASSTILSVRAIGTEWQQREEEEQ